MSAAWDSYIDNLIERSKSNADKACIIGLDGSKWTTDGHKNALKITAKEAVNIGKVLKSGDFSSLSSSGVVVGGVKYQFLREMDKKIVLAKKKDNGGLTLQSSKSGIVIGHTKEGGSQGIVNEAVSKIAEYLESVGR